MTRTSNPTNPQISDLATERASILQSVEEDLVDADEQRRILEGYDEATLKAIEFRIDLQIKIEKRNDVKNGIKRSYGSLLSAL